MNSFQNTYDCKIEIPLNHKQYIITMSKNIKNVKMWWWEAIRQMTWCWCSNLKIYMHRCLHHRQFSKIKKKRWRVGTLRLLLLQSYSTSLETECFLCFLNWPMEIQCKHFCKVLSLRINQWRKVMCHYFY